MSLIFREGDLLDCNIKVICQQLNCLAVRPHGLSEAIANKFPYANVYSKRRSVGNRNLAIVEDQGIPGNIIVSFPLKINDPIVIGLYSQFDYGKIGRYNGLYKLETAEMRVQWFCQCLVNLRNFLISNNLKEVAFPYQIGCGLAGGDWSTYFKILENFAKRCENNFKVYIITLKKN